MSTVGARSWQNLKQKRTYLPNGCLLEVVPFEKHKGRHWLFLGPEDPEHVGRELLGEWKTWQRSIYTRQPKYVEGQSSYGRGGGEYRTEMVRESWLKHLGESAEQLNAERTWNEFKRLARNYDRDSAGWSLT